MTDLFDTIIIGGGVTGYGAAMYAGRFQMKTAVIAEKVGGTIILTDDVANYPGFNQITGLDLANKIRNHANDYDVTTFEHKAVSIEKKDECFFVTLNNEEVVRGKTVIFATGTIWRKLNVPGEDEFANKGVHYCALCDGYFYKDKVVAVVGGGDSSAKEALVLAEHASKVYIIYRGEEIRPEPINKQRVEAHEKIEIINQTNVLEIKGEKTVTSVVLDKGYNGSTTLTLDGVFVDIGHIPLTDLAKDVGVALNEKNEIKIDRKAETNVDGVYAAGDCVDTHFKQAITGVAEGVLAAYAAYTYISEKDVVGCWTD